MVEIKEVQRLALQMAKDKPGFGFLCEMGIGKTLISLMEMCELAAENKATRFVVLCPNSFKSGWQDEIEKWELPLHPFVFHSGASVNNAFLKQSFDRPPVLIVNYEAIRSASTQEYILNFIEGRDAGIYADESIQISTHNSVQTKSAVYLAKHFKYRRILSGKWMKGGPHDIWSQMRFIGQLDNITYYPFRTAFCKMGGFKGKQVVGARQEERLGELIDPHVFVALKKDWTDLPPKVYTTREYTMTAEMKRHFDSMMEDFIVALEEGIIAVDVAITKYIKLAQIQAGFILDDHGEVKQLVEDSANPRLNTLLTMLEDELSGKVIIPYHHKYSGEQLRRALARYQPARIAGGMTPQEISDEKRRFNTDPNCRIILLQTRASKYGHTLLGDQTIDDLACRTMVFYENTYALDDRSQIEDRMHRHGQTSSSVLYVDLVGTEIDRNMTKALQRKEDIYQAVMKFISRTASSGS